MGLGDHGTDRMVRALAPSTSRPDSDWDISQIALPSGTHQERLGDYGDSRTRQPSALPTLIEGLWRTRALSSSEVRGQEVPHRGHREHLGV